MPSTMRQTQRVAQRRAAGSRCVAARDARRAAGGSCSQRQANSAGDRAQGRQHAVDRGESHATTQATAATARLSRRRAARRSAGCSSPGRARLRRTSAITARPLEPLTLPPSRPTSSTSRTSQPSPERAPATAPRTAPSDEQCAAVAPARSAAPAGRPSDRSARPTAVRDSATPRPTRRAPGRVGRCSR